MLTCRTRAHAWTRRMAVALIGALSVLLIPVRAQTTPPSDITITTDRPSVTESSIVVPLGGFQAENGLQVTDTAGNYVLDLPETNLRYGLLSKTELRLAVPDYFQSISSGPSGFGDLAPGIKQQIGPLHGFDLSAVFFLSFPTGANAISSHGYDPGLQFPWSRSLSANWTIAGQGAFYWPTQDLKHNFTGQATFLLSRQLSKPWAAFAEYAGDFPKHGGTSQILHFGTTYDVTPRQQIDFHVGVGLSDAAPRVFVGFGYSFLILTRKK